MHSFKESLKGGLIAGVFSLIVCALLHQFFLPLPHNLMSYTIGGGIGGFFTGFISAFLGIFMYIKTQGRETS